MPVWRAGHGAMIQTTRRIVALGASIGGTQYFVKVIDGPLVNRHWPSVDVLFHSVARSAGATPPATAPTPKTTNRNRR